MVTVTLILLVLALIFIIGAAAGQMPRWPAPFCLVLLELLRLAPLG